MHARFGYGIGSCAGWSFGATRWWISPPGVQPGPGRQAVYPEGRGKFCHLGCQLNSPWEVPAIPLFYRAQKLASPLRVSGAPGSVPTAGSQTLDEHTRACPVFPSLLRGGLQPPVGGVRTQPPRLGPKDGPHSPVTRIGTAHVTRLSGEGITGSWTCCSVTACGRWDRTAQDRKPRLIRAESS
jgi:hypothetical protein